MQRNGAGLVCGCMMWMILENTMVPLIVNRKYKSNYYNYKNKYNNNVNEVSSDSDF